MSDQLLPLNGEPEAKRIAPRGMMDVPIGRVLELAIEKGASAGDLEKLIALHERMQANAARQAFSQAMADFKANCPPIPRRTENSQFSVTVNGVKRPRRYAALEDIEATIRGPLGVHGLSFRWSGSTVAGGKIAMTCIVSHLGGHSESSSVEMQIDSKAGCSDQQKYGAAMTYAQRYSLIQALGLTTCDEDNDGNEAREDPTTIGEGQAAEIGILIDESGADKRRFLAFLGVQRVEDIKVSQYQLAVSKLREKKAAKGVSQ